MSYIEPKVNTMIIEDIVIIFCDFVIAGSKNHTSIGMGIELLDNNKLGTGMKSYIQESINYFD